MACTMDPEALQKHIKELEDCLYDLKQVYLEQTTRLLATMPYIKPHAAVDMQNRPILGDMLIALVNGHSALLNAINKN